MARTKTKGVTIRRVKSKEDRKRPSIYMRLNTDEGFAGYALFEPDPEAENNPGYFEYYDHWDQQGNTYVPCVGDDCPFCSANLNPSTRAATVWYFPDNDKGDQLKVFSMNYKTISVAADESDEEEGILGKKVRVRRLSDNGDYRFRITSDKPLTKKEISALLKQVEEELNLEDILNRQLAAQMERLKALDALEDDEDDDEEEDEPKKTTRKGKAIVEEEEEDEDEDEDDEEEEEEDEDDEDEDEEDDEEEDEDDDEETDDEDEEEAEEESTMSGAFEIVKASTSDETFDMKGSDGKKVKFWVNEDVDVDFEDFPKGTMVNVEAQQDDEGDWVITKIGKKRGRKPAAKK